MVIDTDKLKVSTKTLFSALLAFGGAMQVPDFSHFVGSVTSTHPHIASAVAFVTAMALLLHNPQVQDALGIAKDSASDD